VLAVAAWFGLVPETPPAPPQQRQQTLPDVISAAPGDIRVVDGDTLRLGAFTVRLAGLDAPERGQDCQRADGTRFDCGEAAARHMASLVRRRAVSCDTIGRDRYGRAVGICRAEGTDLAEAMVASGWALAVPEGSRGQARYGMAEAQARSGRQGLWEGRFQTPESWRRGN
jgi:endonuclease YncB( thermonuclease family)